MPDTTPASANPERSQLVEQERDNLRRLNAEARVDAERICGPDPVRAAKAALATALSNALLGAHQAPAPGSVPMCGASRHRRRSGPRAAARRAAGPRSGSDPGDPEGDQEVPIFIRDFSTANHRISYPKVPEALDADRARA